MQDLFTDLKSAIEAAVRSALGDAVDAVPLEFPPDPSFGDLATPVALGLARTLRRKPREIAEEVARAIRDVSGIAEVSIAGPGFVNVRIDRSEAVHRLLDPAASLQTGGGKIVVEHTNINPNKAAHIGHLRNAVLGDSLVRALRALGHRVEVQNYIDDTGVQVADVVVALQKLEGVGADGFEAMVRRAEERVLRGGAGVDHDLWDLYARITSWYDEDKSRESLRSEALAALERHDGEIAHLGAFVAREVVRCHLRTMERLGVRYDLLPKESDILAHRFWHAAFERLKAADAIHLSESGKTAGCWVMNLPHDEDSESEHEYEKVIVRSNGVVTYVGKDIAYQMWKFGLLAADFEYRPFPLFSYADAPLWETAPPGSGADGAPPFGSAERVYNVIDVRQSYLQRVVRRGLEAQGYAGEAERSIHFAYEMVALSPQTALEIKPDLQLSDEDRKRAYLDMSGRKGLGVKADDLIDRLEEKARAEVQRRAPDLDAARASAIGHDVAIGALRYYMLRFTRNKVVAFDIDDALAFEGETGPYAQYASVRVARILEKYEERFGIPRTAILDLARRARFDAVPAEQALEHWTLVHVALRLPDTVRAAVANLELATLAKYAFELSQAINGFYHKFPILKEESSALRETRLAILLVADGALRAALGMMGVPVPPRM